MQLTLGSKATDITLSNGDLDAESNSPSGGGSVLGLLPRNAGKFYFEVHPMQFYALNPGFLSGLMRGTSDLNNYTGASSNSWSVASTAAQSNTWANGASGNSAVDGVSSLAHYHRIAVDLDAGKIWFAISNRNGGAWIGGGDPAAGTLPTFTYTPNSTPLYVSLCPRRGDATTATDRNKLRLVTAPANFSGVAPTGFGEWEGLPPYVGCAIGDSTVADYDGQPSIASIMDPSGQEIASIAHGGDTIAQQEAAWAAFAGKAALEWVVIQVGLNDIDPGETAATALARLQSLVNAVNASKPAGCLTYIATMIPAYARMVTRYGVNAPTAYAKWQAMNRAIRGLGCSAIVCVDGRITSHTAALDDGNGNLDALYDTGDGIHPNLDGREIIADAWTVATGY